MKRYIKAAIKNMSEEGLDVRRNIAGDPNTRVDVLRDMADTNEYFIQLGLATNPNTPQDILDKFTDFRHYSSNVRAAVASNPSTTKDMLYKLMRPSNPDIYRAIASNPITPLDLLDEIAHMPSFDFASYGPAKAAIARRNDVTEGMLIYLSCSEDPNVRAWAARNPKTPESTLQRLANDKSWEVRDSVTKNPRFPDLKL